MLAIEMLRRMKQGILEIAEPFLTRKLNIMTVLGILLLALLIHWGNQNQPHKPTEKLNFLLVGRTGNGKSTSGNTILGKKVFKAGISTNSISKQFQLEHAIVLGRNVTVVDGPGLGDTQMTDENSVKMVIAEAEKSLAACLEGFDAILITIRLGRHSEQDKHIFVQLKAIFGEDHIQRNGIILVTYGDEYNAEENGGPFEEWCANQTGLFRELLDECSGRIVLIDNKSNDRYIQSEQLEKLFEVTRNKKEYTQRYSKRHFSSSQKGRKELLVKIREPQITKDVSEKVTDILERLSSVQLNDLETDKLTLQDLQRLTKNILLKVKQEDDGTGVLKKLEKMVEQAKASVDTRLDNLKHALKHEDELNQMKEQFKRKEFQNEKERNDQERRIKMKEDEMSIKMKKMRLDYEMFRKEFEESQRRGSDNLIDILGDLANWGLKFFTGPSVKPKILNVPRSLTRRFLSIN